MSSDFSNAFSILLQMPILGHTDDNESYDQHDKKILQRLKELSFYPLDVIRVAEEAYLGRRFAHANDHFEAYLQMYIVHRYIFDVPMYDKPSEIGEPILTSPANKMWPLATADDGLIYVCGHSRAWVGGPGDPIHEFNHFYATYGLRFPGRAT